MANIPMFMSPRSDLTIRNLTAKQIEAIANAAVAIVGGVVSFSESAIYESEDTTKEEESEPPWALCPYLPKHDPHEWSTEKTEYNCPGRVEHAPTSKWCGSEANNCFFGSLHKHGTGCSASCSVCHGKPVNG